MIMKALAGSISASGASFEEVHEIALLIEEHGTLGAALLSHWNNDVGEVRRLFDDGFYLGAFDSVADYAQEITEETTEIPDHLKCYLDYVSMARDMEYNGNIFTIELGHEVYIFMNHRT